MRKFFAAILFLCAYTTVSYCQTAAEMCRNMKESAKCCMTPEEARNYQPYIRKMCSGGASARRYADQTNALREQSQRVQQEETANAVGSFMLGFATGFIGSYNPGGGGGVVRGSTVRSGTRVVTHGTTTVRTVNTVSAPATVRTAPVATSTVRTTTTSRSSGGPIGYITQPNGKKDAVYSKQPCATTQQTGPTSYECTNK